MESPVRDTTEHQPGHIRGSQHVHAPAARTVTGMGLTGPSIPRDAIRAERLAAVCPGSGSPADTPQRARPISTGMGGCNRRIRIRYGRRLPIPRRPVVHLVLPLFQGYTDQNHHRHKTQGGRAIQRPISCHPICTSETFRPQYGHLSSHMHSCR